MANGKGNDPISIPVKRVKTGEGVNKDGMPVVYYQYKLNLDAKGVRSFTLYLPEDTPLARKADGSECDCCYVNMYVNRWSKKNWRGGRRY